VLGSLAPEASHWLTPASGPLRMDLLQLSLSCGDLQDRHDASKPNEDGNVDSLGSAVAVLEKCLSYKGCMVDALA
jgi:hypothetical protein